MTDKNKYVNSLRKQAQFSLFITSYAPLFALIILKQLYTNGEFLYWGGISIDSIICFVEKFGLSSILFIVGIYGLWGVNKTMKKIRSRSKDGTPVDVVDVKNKNSESVNYIATYIIPFAFQSFGSWFELIAIIAIILIIYRIFINSSLLLVNPLLSLKYGLYEIKYTEKGRKENKDDENNDPQNIKNAMMLTENKFIVEKDSIIIYPIGHKMFYAKNN